MKIAIQEHTEQTKCTRSDQDLAGQERETLDAPAEVAAEIKMCD